MITIPPSATEEGAKEILAACIGGAFVFAGFGVIVGILWRLLCAVRRWCWIAGTASLLFGMAALSDLIVEARYWWQALRDALTERRGEH